MTATADDLVARLKQRAQAPSFFVNAVGVAGCAAAPAVIQPQPSHMTGVVSASVGPDKDLMEAAKEIEQLRALRAQLDRQVCSLMSENARLRQGLQDALQIIPAKTIAASDAIAKWVESIKSLLACNSKEKT